MHYSIGEMANITGIAISTLRYYDKEGLFPEISRSNGGIRVFSDSEIEVVKIIECLKATGMPIKDIKQFFDWCKEGDSSIEKRLNMFKERREVVEQQMRELADTLDTINFKCWYYTTALTQGSELVVKNMPIEEMPVAQRKYKIKYLNNLKKKPTA